MSELSEAREYLRNCTDAQVIGVAIRERERLREIGRGHMNEAEGEIADTARAMLEAAELEADKRGLYIEP